MTEEEYKKLFTRCIAGVGYNIIDNIISPIVGIKDVLANLYFATIEDYALDVEEIDKIIKEISNQYDLDEDYISFMSNCPLIVIITHILEKGYLAEVLIKNEKR